MTKEDFEKESNIKYERTISWMVDVANTFYPMTEPEKEELKARITKLLTQFINGCESREKEETSE